VAAQQPKAVHIQIHTLIMRFVFFYIIKILSRMHFAGVALACFSPVHLVEMAQDKPQSKGCDISVCKILTAYLT